MAADVGSFVLFWQLECRALSPCLGGLRHQTGSMGEYQGVVFRGMLSWEAWRRCSPKLRNI